MQLFSRLGLRHRSKSKLNAVAACGEVTVTIVHGQPAFQVERLQRWTSNVKPVRRIAPMWLAILAGFALLVHPTNVAATAYTPGQIIALTNAARQDHGFSILRSDDRLMQAAAAKAQDMLAQGYFSHTAPSGLSPWTWFTKSGYAFTEAGENLAMDFVTATGVLNTWLDSSMHRHNILSPKFTDTGVAVLSGTMFKRSTILVVQFFGHQSASSTSGQLPLLTQVPTSIQSQPTLVKPQKPTAITFQTTPAPAVLIPIQIPSIVYPETVPDPDLTFTLQAPSPEYLTSRSFTPRVEGVQSPTQSLVPSQSTVVRQNLPLLFLIVVLVDFLAIAAFGLLQRRGQITNSDSNLRFSTNPIPR